MANLTTDEINKILKLLGKSGVETISNKYKVTPDYVRKVIKGQRTHENIFDSAIAMSIEESKKQNDKIKEVKSLLKSI